jgi:dTDP-4-dehydrorhamnose 3,5-epimerase
MRLTATAIPGAFIVELEPASDDRGFFARQWCARELEAAGLVGQLAQASLSHNGRKHTLRGMHYAAGETKLVHCTRGAIYDVLVDLRGRSVPATWFGVELTSDNHRMVYVPEGVAHGFLTLEDRSDVQYFISAFFDPQAARGVRWDDPAFGIAWPAPPAVIAARDASYPDWRP